MPKKARGTRAQMAFVTGMRLDLRKRGGIRIKEQTKKKKKNVRFESSRSLKNFGAIFIFLRSMVYPTGTGTSIYNQVHNMIDTGSSKIN